jgi:hypothetical protein
VSPHDVALARQQWEDGSRRFESVRESDPALYRALLDLLELVTAELRGRVGQTFTLDELTAEYERAEDWSREAMEDDEPPAVWPRYLTTVTDAAFHEYARGATDYEP